VIRKAAFLRNLRNRSIGVAQKARRRCDARFRDELVRRDAKDALDDACEARRR